MNFQRTQNNHILCGKCHTENPSDAVYCRNCGLLFTQKPVKKKSSKKWLWLLLLIPVLGLAAYAVIWYAMQPSYLYIDGETLSSIEVEPTGGTAVFSISTDADYYSVNAPSWVTVEKGFGVLTLSYDSNESDISRTGTVRLYAGDLESRLVLNQEPNTEPSASIEKVWCEHGVFRNGQKGMEIHVKFHVKRMLGKTGRCNVYFSSRIIRHPLRIIIITIRVPTSRFHAEKISRLRMKILSLRILPCLCRLTSCIWQLGNLT